MNYHRFAQTLFQSHTSYDKLPQKIEVYRFIDSVLQMLFPQFADQTFKTPESVEAELYELQNNGEKLLIDIEPNLPAPAATIANQFAESLPRIYDLLLNDARAMADGDPAATSPNEVILAYPGFYAIAIYRMAHRLCQLGVPLIPRLLTEYAHQKTGIDIHPGATIGEHFCIDHGTGIVIGQTTVIGNRVKIYQGVTLGALSVEKTLAGVKRHPTIEDNVVIYAGATILGGHVVVGHDSIIGGNVWLTESIKPYSKVYNKTQIKVSGAAYEKADEYLEYYI
ncbi:serine acetyltransferase [Xanthocytophaga agilis]|uniref:Serine acetyltransferase n=1 Tax=Xanthocytophaga agilis TaxID=3048010 RepID=A0AAE3UBK1_9BACT|nr:serine acetyltransferase [Xanthocytophaga agilis]MDJ1499125.1 serine acetyltransferase [Xanthocytophaga agilis]